jgi:hypothetical protein
MQLLYLQSWTFARRFFACWQSADTIFVRQYYVCFVSRASGKPRAAAWVEGKLACSPKSNDSGLFRKIDSLKSEGNDCNTELARLRVHVATELAVAALSATSREELAGWARSLVAYRRHEKCVWRSENT